LNCKLLFRKGFPGLLLLATLRAPAAEPATNQVDITVRPPDTGQALVNPDMGWVLQF